MKDVAAEYLKEQVTTASPEQLLIMLFDAAIRFLVQAKLAMAKNDTEKAHNGIMKAQNILTELMSSLDTDSGLEVTKNLYNLYEYYHYRLVQANIKHDITMIDEVLDQLRAFKTTWEQAIDIAARERQHAAPKGEVLIA